LDDSLLILCVASALISLVAAAQFVAAVRRSHRPLAGAMASERPARLSVIIPARDEEQDLAASLRSVLEQEDVELEIIVVNDHSSDRTGAIADELARSDPRLRVLHNPALPPGWLGKVNAMERGAALATGELFLFTDADVVHAPRCFVTAIAELESRELDFLSLFPLMDCVSVGENVILPALVGGLALLATPGIEDPRSPDALAAGAFLMIRAPVWRRIGGFEPIKHEMLDDVALARLVKRHGGRVAFYLAPELLRVRLYKGNRHAFWAMTKNILEGLHGRFWLAPLVMFLPVLVYWTPLLAAIVAVRDVRPGLLGLAVGTYGLQYATIAAGHRLFRFRPQKALLFPLVVLPVFCCMARALFLYARHGAVHWRGRTIPVINHGDAG
jgi:glycosyltransferase involved in cell wall biosynthesis